MAVTTVYKKDKSTEKSEESEKKVEKKSQKTGATTREEKEISIKESDTLNVKESKEKLEEDDIKTVNSIVKDQQEKGIYFGYRIKEDNSVKELRLPKAIIELITKTTKGLDYSKEDIVPGKYFICSKCGFKSPRIKGKLASMFTCPRDGRTLMAT